MTMRHLPTFTALLLAYLLPTLANGDADAKAITPEIDEVTPDFVPAASYGSHYEYDDHHDYKHEHHEPMPYYFSYGVKDDYHYNDYGHQETSDGKGGVKGSYYVHLPDGRTQIVKYHADHHSGYQAEVTYKGKSGHDVHHDSYGDGHHNHKYGHDHKYEHHDHKYGHDHKYEHHDHKYGHDDKYEHHDHKYSHKGHNHHGHKDNHKDHKYGHNAHKYGNSDHKYGTDHKYANHDHSYSHKREDSSNQMQMRQDPLENTTPVLPKPPRTADQFRDQFPPNRGFVPIYNPSGRHGLNQVHVNQTNVHQNIHKARPATGKGGSGQLFGQAKMQEKVVNFPSGGNFDQLKGFTYSS